MEINTNPNSIVPLYAQIVESLKRDIENGVFRLCFTSSEPLN